MRESEIKTVQAVIFPIIGNARQAVSLLRAAGWHCKSSAKRLPEHDATFYLIGTLAKIAQDAATELADDVEKLYAQLEQDLRLLSIGESVEADDPNGI